VEMASIGAERLRAAVEANQIEQGGISLGVTISVGVAERGPQAENPDELLRLADDALYEAKRSGRNRVCVSGTGVAAVSPSSLQKPVDAAPAPASESARGEDSRGVVLVVDDDPSARLLARKILEQDGFEVHEAPDGRHALTKVPEICPDVILMDAVMPNLDGFECTRRLSANPSTCEIPIIMVSGQTDEKHVEAGFVAGAREYVTKPLRRREFALRVRAMAELYRGKKALLASNNVRGEQARAMQILFDLSRSLANDVDLDAMVDHTAAATAELMCSHRVSVMLPDDTSRNLIVAGAIGIDDQLAAKIQVPVGTAIAGKVFATGKPIVLNSPSEAIECNARYDTEFFASVPLASKAMVVANKVMGVLNVTNRHDRRPFAMHEIEYLDLVCNMTASAIEQLLSGQARERAYAAIVIGLAKLAEHRDADTGKHLERVTQYALLLAGKLRKSPPYTSTIDDCFRENLEQAMPLHDIGKVAVSDAILLKPGRLTDAEFTAMKRHTVVGASAIQSMVDQAPDAGFLAMARDIAFCHHERCDGTGYPRGLKGDQIPLAARIAAVADAYDALTTVRPYKAAFSHEKAVDIIRGTSGSHFDPKIVASFLCVEKQFAEMAARIDNEDRASHAAAPATELAACST
ncbi:MAG: response regulator, partial [Planctomycetes bacterium]|nr:response regulator [Planctomycetota bacterium]